MLLYHVTKKENLEQIHGQGLIPKCGDNAVLCHEQRPYVYLCPKESVPHWMILTQSDAVLSVQAAVGEDQLSEYDSYKEYLYPKPVMPANIKDAEMPSRQQLDDAMTDLVKNYCYTMCDVCCALLRKELDPVVDKEDAQTLTEVVRDTVAIMRRLDFRHCSQDIYKNLFLQYSNDDCAITVADYYYAGADPSQIADAGKRCFEHLANLKGPYAEAGRLLHGFITEVFDEDTLHPADIGGFWI